MDLLIFLLDEVWGIIWVLFFFDKVFLEGVSNVVIVDIWFFSFYRTMWGERKGGKI